MIDAEYIRRLMEFFDRNRRSFQLVFSRTNPADMHVLAMLADFCCATKSTAIGDNPYKTARLEGRREVWNFIQRAINLTPEEQYDLNTKKDHP